MGIRGAKGAAYRVSLVLLLNKMSTVIWVTGLLYFFAKIGI